MNNTNTALAVAPIGPWDRLAIVLLGAAGCALSYDALQQMAVAIHIRGLLTYLFPLVIDGFIAYGVRALLVLSTAPLRARLYVWTLFGTATAASIWANALHAVRLNQQTNPGGLRLGDTVVAVLSTLAPLALAGAVHLYILITRHHTADRTRTSRAARRRTTQLTDHTRHTEPARTETMADRPRTGPHEAPTAGPDHRTEPDLTNGPADHRGGPSPDRTTTGPDRTTDAGPDHRTASPQWPANADQPAGSSGQLRHRAADRTRTGITAGHTADQAQMPDRTAGTDKSGPSPDRTTDGPSADRPEPDLTNGPADHRGGPSPDQLPTAPDGPRTNTSPDRTTTGPFADQTTGPDRTTDAGPDHRTGPSPDRDQDEEEADKDADRAEQSGGEPVSLEDLLPVARQAALSEGRMTRKALRPHLRSKGIPLSNERFTALQQRLYRDPALAHLPQPKRRRTQ
ncbi:DUF2637 domain-containing protein [Streptomyces bathyalis]|uniref:DUF2637 domain-containing protein n=1 Tax=Streptomyces bathyalis TaxID=2710756 RepID=A0A7T1T2F4_9ACTN|nr:DUF2637 domain-containing protein [Streptomyces bathyalis]